MGRPCARRALGEYSGGGGPFHSEGNLRRGPNEKNEKDVTDKWTGTVTIPTSVTLSGGANDVWIFQISGNLTPASASNVILAGGAQAKNVFWQVAGNATLGTGSHFEGIILSQTAVNLNTNATMVGRALAQSAVALDHGTITNP
jgi:hypothetical protein